MKNTRMSLISHLVVVCVLLEKSVVLSSCVVNEGDGIYCSESPTNSPPYVYCETYSSVNATTLRNVLTSCTVGEPYQMLIIRDWGGDGFELQLDLGDNITDLYISFVFSGRLYINPLRQHTNITYLSIENGRWETRDLVLSEYFPNLEVLDVSGEYSMTTIDNNLLSNLTSLTSFTWRGRSLVNISVDAFRGLSSLSYIYLSYNRIPYLSSESFEHLPSLRELIVNGGQLNCTCQLQWMSIVDTNGWVDIVGECDGTGLSVDSPSTYSQCHNTESYECFNKSISCEYVCINTPNSYVCACDAGYGLTLSEAEEACHDIDECVQNVAICEGQSCRNTLGSYECYCSEGFVSDEDGSICVDVDECITENGGCEDICTNTAGGYTCACDVGYGLSLSEAEEACHDIDECVQNVAICEGQSCRNTLGSYECYCSEGFVSGANGSICVDVDECMTDNGGCEDICTNTAGDYRCGCYPNVNQSVNTVSNAVLIVISVIQTIIIFVLGISLAVVCYLYWKRGQQQKSIPKQDQTIGHAGYTQLQPSEPKLKSEPQSTYTYIDGDVVEKFMKSVAYPTVKSSSPVHDDKEKETEYMNLSDM